MPIPAPAALHHTCFLVRDLEATAQRLADSLGVAAFEVRTIVPAWSRVHGKECPFTFRVALGMVGGAAFELVTPHTGTSVYDEHLATHGESFHHTCLVYPTIGALREASAELKRQGRVAIQEAGAGDLFEFAYFDFPEIGSAVEVLFLDIAEMPPAEAVIHPRG
jgi:catechol 2,3-dioxygenase-like lactoylglutathione lyase family enzyme